jgi:hypothetical protein
MYRYVRPYFGSTESSPFFFRICEVAHTMGINYQVYRTTIMYYGKIETLKRSTALGAVTLFGGFITLLVQVRKIKYNFLYTANAQIFDRPSLRCVSPNSSRSHTIKLVLCVSPSPLFDLPEPSTSPSLLWIR